MMWGKWCIGQFCPEFFFIIPFSDITLFHPHFHSLRAHSLWYGDFRLPPANDGGDSFCRYRSWFLFHSLFMIYRDFYFFFDFVLLFHFCYSIQCLLFHHPIRSLLSVSLNFRYSISMNVSYWWRISSFRFKSYLYFYFTTVWIIKVKIPKLKLYDMMCLQSVLILEWLALRYFEFLELFSQMHWCDCEWIGFFFYIDCYVMTDIEKCFSKYV